MSAEDIVARLDFVRQTGPGQWMARCTAHDDRGPSLSIKDAGNGRTLIHCFAGCGAADVLAAIGLELSDLYPPTDRNYHAEKVQRERSIDELTVEIAMADIREGKALSDDDMDRCTAALNRLDSEQPAPSFDDAKHIQRGIKSAAKRESERVKKMMEAWS